MKLGKVRKEKSFLINELKKVSKCVCVWVWVCEREKNAGTREEKSYLINAKNDGEESESARARIII